MSRLTITDIKKKKEVGGKITMLTAYDYPTANVVDEAGVDMILVGDSLGMVVLGYENTLPVTIEEMIHHGKAVVRGSKKALVVVDMPFLSYQVSKEDALRNAGRIICQTGCQAVKLEGGIEIAEVVSAMTQAGIPVMGHLGLTPQSVGQLGGFKVQGKEFTVAQKIIKDALALEDAGAFSIVLECVPRQLAALVTDKLGIPIIGIGAGVDCDGQVLVFHDVVGLFKGLRPKFVQQYIDAFSLMSEALRGYVRDVKNKSFPQEKNSYNMEGEVIERLKKEVGEYS